MADARISHIELSAQVLGCVSLVSLEVAAASGFIGGIELINDTAVASGFIGGIGFERQDIAASGFVSQVSLEPAQAWGAISSVTLEASAASAFISGVSLEVADTPETPRPWVPPVVPRGHSAGSGAHWGTSAPPKATRPRRLRDLDILFLSRP